LAFDTDLAPVVGQQVTLHEHNGAVAGARIDLLRARAARPFPSKILGQLAYECDLVAEAVVHESQMRWLYNPAEGTYQPDDGSAPIDDRTLRALASTPGQEVTFTCVPPGSGVRVALDRDGDGIYNRLDRCPADPDCG
jgi:hypothetical protein